MKNSDIVIDIIGSTIKIILIFCIIIVGLLFIFSISSLPFAFFGLIFISLLSIFGISDISLTYWNCFIIGFGLVMSIGILRVIFSGK